MDEKISVEYSVQNKLLWRCHVCNDIHFGESAPIICPTCGAENAFVVIDLKEALKVVDELGGKIATINDVIRSWEDFGSASEEYKLVEDAEMVRGLAEGVIENKRNHGLKYCPCRITTGNFLEDLKLICPCNFQIQRSYHETGECWCGLFARRGS